MMRRVCLLIATLVAMGCSGGSGSNDGGPPAECISCIAQNCNSQAKVVFGSGYQNNNFTTGVCPNFMSCKNDSQLVCAQQDGPSCETAFNTLVACLDQTACFDSACNSGNNGNNGNGGNGLTVNGSTMNFGNTQVGSAPNRCMVVTGPNASIIIPQVLNDTGCAAGGCAFHAEPLYCRNSDSCDACVTFAPQRVGAVTATLSIASDLTVALSGVGIASTIPGTGGALATGGIVSTGGTTVVSSGGNTGSGGIVGTGGSTVVSSTGGQVTGSGTVTFANGKASGAMTGWGWIALGSNDVVTDPTCGGAPVTSGLVCTSTWNWNSATALCMSGIIPALPAIPAQSDYDANWGVEIGVSAVPQNDPVTNGPMSGIGMAYSSIALAVSGSPLTGLRVSLHRHGDPSNVSYCAVYRSGQIPLTSFNTACWNNSGLFLTVADAPLIDLVMLIVPSTQQVITVANLCVNSITFAGSGGSGGSGGIGGSTGGTTIVSSGGNTGSGGSVGTGGSTVVSGKGGNIGTGGITGVGGTTDQCGLSPDCLTCLKQSCNSQATDVFGSDYVNRNFDGGKCPGIVACSCSEDTRDTISDCVQKSDANCVSAFGLLNSCLNAAPCGSACTGNSPGGTGGNIGTGGTTTISGTGGIIGSGGITGTGGTTVVTSVPACPLGTWTVDSGKPDTDCGNTNVTMKTIITRAASGEYVAVAVTNSLHLRNVVTGAISCEPQTFAGSSVSYVGNVFKFSFVMEDQTCPSKVTTITLTIDQNCETAGAQMVTKNLLTCGSDGSGSGCGSVTCTMPSMIAIRSLQ